MSEEIVLPISPDQFLSHEATRGTSVPLLCLADPSFFIKWVHYLTLRKLDWPVKVAPNRWSPSSLVHLSTEAFRKFLICYQWNTATEEMLESGQIVTINESEAHQQAIFLMNLTESELRVQAGLPA